MFRVRSDSQISHIQPTVQVLNLAALTALEQPALIGDYTRLFLEQHKERVMAAFERYQQALITPSHDIDGRNKHRLLKVNVST